MPQKNQNVKRRNILGNITNDNILQVQFEGFDANRESKLGLKRVDTQRTSDQEIFKLGREEKDKSNMTWIKNQQIPRLPLNKISETYEREEEDEVQNIKYIMGKVKGKESLTYLQNLLFKKVKEMNIRIKYLTFKNPILEKENKNLKEETQRLKRDSLVLRTKTEWLQDYSRAKEDQVKYMIGQQYRFKSKIIKVHNQRPKHIEHQGSMYVKIDTKKTI